MSLFGIKVVVLFGTLFGIDTPANNAIATVERMNHLEERQWQPIGKDVSGTSFMLLARRWLELGESVHAIWEHIKFE